MKRNEAFKEIEEGLLKASHMLEREADGCMRNKQYVEELHLSALREEVEKLRSTLYYIYPYVPDDPKPVELKQI